MSYSTRKRIKRVSVSSKRQISIPKEFFDELNIQDEVIMELVGNKLIVKPSRDQYEDFSEDILQDLIREGYAGYELMSEFKARKSQLRPAVEAMMDDAEKNAEPTTVEELFGEDDNEK